jgi:hypothetical protein
VVETHSPVASAVRQVQLAFAPGATVASLAAASGTGTSTATAHAGLPSVLPAALANALEVVEQFAAQAVECTTPRLVALLDTAAAASAAVADAQNAIRAIRKPGGALDTAVNSRDAAKERWVAAVDALSQQQAGELDGWLEQRSVELSTTLLPAAEGARSTVPCAPDAGPCAPDAVTGGDGRDTPLPPSIDVARAACSAASSAAATWLQTQADTAATGRAATALAANAAATELEAVAVMLRSPARTVLTTAAAVEGVPARLNAALRHATVTASDEIGARMAAESAAGSFEALVLPIAPAVGAVVARYQVRWCSDPTLHCHQWHMKAPARERVLVCSLVWVPWNDAVWLMHAGTVQSV